MKNSYEWRYRQNGSTSWQYMHPAYGETLNQCQRRCTGWEVEVNPQTPKPVVYVAHPVSGHPLTNAVATAEWVRALINLDPSRIYVAPWVAEVLAFPSEVPGESLHHDYNLAIEDDLEVLSRFDEIILVGGRIGPGMQKELDKAKELKHRITDLSQYKTPKDLPEGFFLDPNEETA
jgi:hypothetical protein